MTDKEITYMGLIFPRDIKLPYITQLQIIATKLKKNILCIIWRLPLILIFMYKPAALLYITIKDSLKRRALINFICHKAFVA